VADKIIHGETQRLDKYGRIALTTTGAMEDLKKYEGQLQPCDIVKIVDGNDAEVMAVVDFDYDEDRKQKMWFASPIWSTFRGLY
jgi:hypothetical protein